MWIFFNFIFCELPADGIADDIDDFADKLKTLMLDKDLRVKMGKNAHDDMKDYAPNIIIDKWEELINKVTTSNK